MGEYSRRGIGLEKGLEVEVTIHQENIESLAVSQASFPEKGFNVFEAEIIRRSF